MSEYQRLETKITSYLKRNNIKSTQNIISFYDLYNISINSKEDTTGIYQREWFTRKKLSELVSENNDEILKKIPINVKDLDVKYQNLVTEYKSNNLNG